MSGTQNDQLWTSIGVGVFALIMWFAAGTPTPWSKKTKAPTTWDHRHGFISNPGPIPPDRPHSPVTANPGLTATEKDNQWRQVMPTATREHRDNARNAPARERSWLAP
jgi:hypothetical protein